MDPTAKINLKDFPGKVEVINSVNPFNLARPRFVVLLLSMSVIMINTRARVYHRGGDIIYLIFETDTVKAMI